MSRAGKFVPGGAIRKTGALSTGSGEGDGPIRATPLEGEGNSSSGSNGGGPKKRFFGGKTGLTKPVLRNQKIPITIMSSVVCCVLVSAGWWYMAYLPAQQKAAEMAKEAAAAQKALADEKAAEAAAAAAAAAAQAAAKGKLIVDTNPTGATITLNGKHLTTPATFADLAPGSVTFLIQKDGYEDYSQQVNVTTDKPADLGVIPLVRKVGSLSLSSPQVPTHYVLTGPNGYRQEGDFPTQLTGLVEGAYSVVVTHNNWTLPAQTIVIHDRDDLQQTITFPYAQFNLSSTPSGATVRSGHTIVGQTPFSLVDQLPGTLHFSVDFPGYKVERFDVNLQPAAHVQKDLPLQKNGDFIAASGIVMVQMPDGYWVGKYLVRQSEYEKIMGTNPSYFHLPNRPVESISWDDAVAFCAKLTSYEKAAGKLPPGYHYSLPTESQWSSFVADADINQAWMSRDPTQSLTGTADVGASEPNQYGLYDTLGNVWEWCLDDYDKNGNKSMRGGGWLSSQENFPDANTRTAAAEKYADHFTGMRVVLVKDNP